MDKIEVLLIENSESDALIIAEFLLESTTSDYEITHLLSLKEANSFLESTTVDIILVNLFLTDSFGIHTFNNLFQKYPSTPFLILTDMKDHLIGINAVKKGAQDYLIKNEINANILSRSITYAIERKATEEELRKSEEKYRELFERSKDAIYMSTVDGDFIDINTAGLTLFGYEASDLPNLKVRDLYVNQADRDHLKGILALKGEVADYNVDLIKKDKKTVLSCLLSTMIICDDNKKIIGYQGIIKDISDREKAEKALIKSLHDLDQANKELLHLNATLEEKVNERTNALMNEKELGEKQHNEIIESIQYAKRIQASILPPIKKIKNSLPESFIYYEPKDVVSGDFYWYEEVNKKPLFAVVDCTGHGVPGAFMSIIGYTQLNEIISEQNISTPGIILKELDKRVKLALNQNNKEDKNSEDGMELGIIMINNNEKKLEFSGAMRPLYMVKDGDLHIVKGNKFSIGGRSFRRKEFITTRINIEKGDCFYLFSDGYPDQFGGPRGKKFMTKHVGEMLQGIAHLSMAEQGKVIKKTIKDWMGNEEQVDDILIAGIKF